MPPFPLAKFLSKFGVLLTIVIAFAASIGIFAGIGIWTESEGRTAFPRLRNFLRERKKLQADKFAEYEKAKHETSEFSPPLEPEYPPSMLIWMLLTLALMAALYRGLTALSPAHAKMITGTVFVGALGALLFLLKVKFIYLYALVELIAAVTLAGHTMAGLKDNIALIEGLSLLTSAYLFVRAFENLSKALSGEQPDHS